MMIQGLSHFVRRPVNAHISFIIVILTTIFTVNIITITHTKTTSMNMFYSQFSTWRQPTVSSAWSWWQLSALTSSLRWTTMVMVMKMKALIVKALIMKALIVRALMMVMVLMLMPTTILLKSNHLQAPNTCAAFAGTGEIQNICRFTFFFTLFCQLENNNLL